MAANKETKTKDVKTEKEAKETVKSKPKVKDDFAVIKTGGKQYIVSKGLKIKVEKLPVEEGEEIEFSEVLLKANDAEVKIGAPFIEGAIVKAKVLSQFKDDKIIVFKYKKRKNYRRKQGHRQNLTELEILSI